MARNDSAADAVRITTLPEGRGSDLSHRQRNYLISMAIRVVCFVSAVALLEGWMRWVGVVLAIFLPYVAVVFANGEDQRKESFNLDAPGSAALPESKKGELS